MDWLRALFFESPLLLAAVAFLPLFFLLVYWRRTLRPAPLLVALGATAAILIAQIVVVTNREQAARILDRVERDLLRASVVELTGALSSDFVGMGAPRPEFVSFATAQIERVRIIELDRKRLDVVESGSRRFVAIVGYWAEVQLRDYNGPLRSRWRIEFSRADDGWRISRIDAEEIEGISAPTIATLRE